MMGGARPVVYVLDRDLDADLDHQSKLDLDLKELMAKRQKEQALQLFFNEGCKVSTRSFLYFVKTCVTTSLGPASPHGFYTISLGEEAS